MDFDSFFGDQTSGQPTNLDFASLFDPNPIASVNESAGMAIDPTLLLLDSQAAQEPSWPPSLGLTGTNAPPDFSSTPIQAAAAKEQRNGGKLLQLTGKSPRLQNAAANKQRSSLGGQSPKAQLYNVLKEAADNEAMARAERGQAFAAAAMAAAAYTSATGTSPTLMPVMMDPATGHTVALPMPPEVTSAGAAGQAANWLNPYRPNRRRHCSPHLAAALGIPDSGAGNYVVSPTLGGTAGYYGHGGIFPPPPTLKVPMPAMRTAQHSPAMAAGDSASEPIVPLMLPCTSSNGGKDNEETTPSSTTAANIPQGETQLPAKTLDYFTQMGLTRDLFLKEAAALDFSNVTVLEMKKLLRRFSLNATGKKAALQERILSTVARLRDLTTAPPAKLLSGKEAEEEEAKEGVPRPEANNTQQSVATF